MTHTKSLFTILAVFGMLGCRAQKSELRTVEAFSKIKTSGALEVIYLPSDSMAIRVEARQDEIDRVGTVTDQGVLMISNKGEFVGEVKVYINHQGLKGLDVQGATVFRTEGQLRTDRFELNASGAATVKMEIAATEIIAKQAGASQVQLKGKCDLLQANISGAASLKAYDLEAAEAGVESSGAANVKVKASGKFRGNATGASHIYLQGEPLEMHAEASAAASISRVREKDRKGGDTLTYNLKDMKIIIVDADKPAGKSKKDRVQHAGDFKHWRGLSFAVNGYLTAQGDPDMTSADQYMDLNYARSFNYQINPIERHFYIVRHNFKVVSGLGLDLHRYEFANRTTLRPDTNYTSGTIDSAGVYGYRRNKLRATYIQVPLLVEFNTSNNHKKTFHFAAGVIGQYLVGSSTKQLLTQEGFNFKKVNKDDYNLNPFGLKAHVNMGYRGWTLFAEYSLTTLFRDGRGPELYPVAAGLRVVPFT